jgi:hypothetical protein
MNFGSRNSKLKNIILTFCYFTPSKTRFFAPNAPASAKNAISRGIIKTQKRFYNG